MDSSDNTFMNAVVGALAALVLVVLPFSTIVGGAVAGFLQRGTRRDGATAGVVTGLLLVVPLFLLVLVAAPLVVFAPAGVPTTPGSPLGFAVIGFLATVAYAVGGGALGGTAGAYLAAVRGAGGPNVEPTTASETTPVESTRTGASNSPSED